MNNETVLLAAALTVGIAALCVGVYTLIKLRRHLNDYEEDCWNHFGWRLRIEANEDDIEDLQEHTGINKVEETN